MASKEKREGKNAAPITRVRTLKRSNSGASERLLDTCVPSLAIARGEREEEEESLVEGEEVVSGGLCTARRRRID